MYDLVLETRPRDVRAFLLKRDAPLVLPRKVLPTPPPVTDLPHGDSKEVLVTERGWSGTVVSVFTS